MVVEYWGCKDANDDLASRQSTSDKLEWLRTELKIWIFITPLGTVTIDQTNDVDLFGGVDNDVWYEIFQIKLENDFHYNLIPFKGSLRCFVQGLLLPIQSCCLNRGPIFVTWSKHIQWKKRFQNKGQCLLTHVCGQIRSNWTMTLKTKGSIQQGKNNGSLKDKMIMPKQAHLDSRIKVSSWCPLHFMTRPLSRAPLSSSQLSPGCSSHVGCGQDGGSRGKYHLNHFHPHNLRG